METKNPTAFFQIERIGNITFYLYLRKGINVIKQTFTLDELPVIVSGIENFTTLSARLVIEHLEKIFGRDLLNQYLKAPLNAWEYQNGALLMT